MRRWGENPYCGEVRNKDENREKRWVSLYLKTVILPDS